MKRFFRLAKTVAAKGNDRRRYRLGAVGVRSDGAIVKSKNIPNKYPEPQAHAEARLAKKLDRGSIVYVVRIDSDGELTKARPCASCQRILRFRGVKRVYYSISETEYGVIKF
jgi:tRNA(Arg) A34 adenosine deaminase TadA